MIRNWTLHLKTDEEKERFKREVSSSKAVLERLTEMLNEIERDQDNIERNPKIYDTPNWDYKMAHLNGFKQAISKIKFIINLDSPSESSP
jgi:hypothetical protein